MQAKKKYRSDLEVFIRESKLEDFYPRTTETIFVSTIHKAKGKEFDNVFLMLENFAAHTDETKRQLYVAITRAKQNLGIHVNSNLFDNITTDNLERIERFEENEPPNQLATYLTHKDVWLDYFRQTQQYVSDLVSGDDLVISGDECLNINRKPILKFSKSFLERINEKVGKGYHITSVKVNFVLYWQIENTGHEIKIVLPRLLFKRKTELPR